MIYASPFGQEIVPIQGIGYNFTSLSWLGRVRLDALLPASVNKAYSIE